ncbi:MAG TPA: hypothetical protein K8V32_01040 [Enteractinococcus helveticum]|uniref:Uncharacterized protein n=1 Tax=Enteractinococcus helveticum TaxID=1837282 RepID=A0A921FMB7_9MICC|nr:hypothetical protein [Enteractinococcus helveticum]HJF13376.1 hypothetical protein [Enteractinococcus helveticum]
MTFTSIDYDKFRQLRVTHIATRLEELITDEHYDTLTPEQLFLTAVDQALEHRRANRVDRLIKAAKFPILGCVKFFGQFVVVFFFVKPLGLMPSRRGFRSRPRLGLGCGS